MRKFWIQRSLVTKNNMVQSHYEVYTEWSAKLAVNEYYHGDEIIPVVEVGDSDYITLRVKKPEGYEDVHPELLLQDLNLPEWAEIELVDEEI